MGPKFSKTDKDQVITKQYFISTLFQAHSQSKWTYIQMKQMKQHKIIFVKCEFHRYLSMLYVWC